MKIMLVSRIYPTHRAGGMGHVCQDRAHALAALGHDVHVVTTASPPVKFEKDVEVKVQYTASPSQKWSAEFAKACCEWAEYNHPDIIHLDSFDRNNMWWPGKAKRTAVTMHGFGQGAWQTRWNMFRAGRLKEAPIPDTHALDAEANALSQANIVIGVSKHEYRMLRDEYGLNQAQLVYNPIAPYFFKPVVPQYGKWRSQCQCGCHEGKLMHFRPCCNPDIVRTYFLCAAVSGQAERGFKEAEQACKIAGVPFKAVSGIRREDMPAVYDGAIALLLPTAYGQGWDLSVGEARARGCPAIVSATGSYLAEAMAWDTLVKPLDVHSLTEVLKTYKNPYTSEQIQLGALKHMPKTHAEEWLEVVLS